MPDRGRRSASLGRGSNGDSRPGGTNVMRSERAQRELGLLVGLLVLVARGVDGPLAWPVAGLTFGVVVLGGVRIVLGPTIWSQRTAIAPVLVAGVLAAGAVGAIRVVPVGLWLVPAVVGVALVLEWILGLDRRLAGTTGRLSADDRTMVVAALLAAAFVAFVGVAAAVPGGMVEPVPPGAPESVGSLPEAALLILAVADALLAGLLGYRAALLRMPAGRPAATSALGYALVVAIGAGALRALAIPRVLGPALLTLVFFLWDSFQRRAPARRRDPRWIIEVAVVAMLGIAVVILNLQLRG